MTAQRDPQDLKPHGLARVIFSVLAAFFGVQSERNRERDFKHGKAAHYVIVGLVMTFLFVLALVILVRWVLQTSGV